MSKEKQMTIEEYRKKHKRCKTCEWAGQSNVTWRCIAKGTVYVGRVGETGLKGCFCKLYQPMGGRQ